MGLTRIDQDKMVLGIFLGFQTVVVNMTAELGVGGDSAGSDHSLCLDRSWYELGFGYSLFLSMPCSI
jgi:hypothetical protein